MSLINNCFKNNLKPLSGPNLSDKATIYNISKYESKSKIIVLTCIS